MIRSSKIGRRTRPMLSDPAPDLLVNDIRGFFT
jgi:hypothetical protein